MHKKDCFYLGKVAKKFSFKGEVLVYLDTDEPEIYQNLESVFVEFNGHLVPFFILSASIHRSSFLRVQFEDMFSEEEADRVIGCNVYLPLQMLPKLEGNKFYFHEIVDFEVQDKRLGYIGKVVRVNDSNAQALFEIDFDGKVVLVPMIDDFIQKVDRQNKTLYLDTPLGLVDLYIG